MKARTDDERLFDKSTRAMERYFKKLGDLGTPRSDLSGLRIFFRRGWEMGYRAGRRSGG